MTLNLTEAEMAVLEELSQKKDMSKSGVMRQALRLYQLVDRRLAAGGQLFFEDNKKDKAQLLLV